MIHTLVALKFLIGLRNALNQEYWRMPPNIILANSHRLTYVSETSSVKFPLFVPEKGDLPAPHDHSNGGGGLMADPGTNQSPNLR